MHATTSQQSYPKYSIATAIILLLFIGVPALLTAIDPGSGDNPTAAAEVIANATNITYTAPAGWNQEDSVGSTVLKKGAVTIQLQLTPWTGTPAELYESIHKRLEKDVKLVSMEDPSPTTVNGMPAVEGQAHMIINGVDTSTFIVVSADGTSGILSELDGPMLDVQSLKKEFMQLLSTISISGLELE